MADNLIGLQRQAARRVREMQEHSRRVLEAHQETLCETEPPRPAPALPHLETEQWLLLGLALLLMRCGGRTELVLALLYLAL